MDTWDDAVDRGDLAVVRALIGNVDAADRSRAMYRATDKDAVEIVKELVAHGEELEEYFLGSAIRDKAENVARWVLEQRPGDATREGVFAEACATMSIEFLELLLAHGAKIDDREDGWGALAVATREKRADVIEWLVKQQAPARGWLLGAAAADDLAAAKRALEAGDEPGVVDERGRTPLMIAARANARAVAAWLVELLGGGVAPATAAPPKRAGKSRATSKKRRSKGPLDATDVEGDTAIAYAAVAGHLEMVQLLADAGAALDAAMAKVSDGAYRKPEGQLALARLLLDRGANVDARQASSQDTALIEAANAGWLEMVELLLGRGADVHLANIIDTTALSGAARGGHAEVVKRLLAAGARLARHGEYGESPLERAIESGHTEIVRLFLERGALDVRSRKPPLLAAAEKGDREIVELLIEAGADIHHVDDSYDQDTALRKAAGAGHREIVELLIDRGAREPGLREGYDDDEYTAIRRAGARGHLDVVELLAQRGFGDPRESGIVTGVAEASDDPAKLERALAIAPDVEAPGQYGRKPLHRAVDRGYLGNVRVLLDHGADPNARDKDGSVPHRIATDRGHRTIVELLEARGAKLELVELIELAATGTEAEVLAMLARPVNVNVSRDGRRPLHAAAESGRVAIVRALLERGAEVDAVDKEGWTALMEAADMGHVAVVEVLLDSKAAPFVTDRAGFTACAVAEDAGRADVVALMRARWADVDPAVAFQRAIEEEDVAAIARLAPLHGLTAPLPSYQEPLVHAVIQSKPKAVAALIAAGAEVDRTLNNYGYTPLYHAAERANLATVRALLAAGAKPRTNGTTLRAVCRGEVEMVAALLDAGFDIDELQEGRALLQFALESGRDAVVRLLLDRGASVRGQPGAKLLSRATWHEQFAWVIDELLAKGAPVDGSEYSMLEKIEAWVAEGRAITLLDPQAALSYSTWHDRLGVMELALAQGANPSAWHEDSDERPILRAASSGYWRLVERLLAAGADPNVSTYRSLAQAVAEAGEHALLVKLAEHGARMLGCINAMLRYDKLPADPATRVELVRLCLAHGDDLDTPDHEGTPLGRALRAHDEPLARLLVELGASVNAPDESLVTPLMVAAETGTLPLVRWLVEAGADVAAVSKHDTTAIHYAARTGKEDVVEFLLERGASVTGCLRESAASGKRALVERFLPLCDLEEKAAGWHITPAMNAAAGPSKKVFELLLDRGASVEYCAIMAAEAGNKAHLAIALGRGAKVDTREWIQRTALMVASDHPACIQLLLKAGASLDLQDEDGRTALMHAANDGNKKSCQLLLAAGANRGLRDANGRAAVDYARHDRALRSLLEV